MKPLLFAPLFGLALAGQSPPQSTAAPATRVSTPAAREAMMEALGHAMQGDMGPALRALQAVAAADLSAPTAAIRACILDRFGPAAADPPAAAGVPPETARILAIYRAYWRRALLDPAARAAEEERLRRDLAALLGAAPATTMTDLE